MKWIAIGAFAILVIIFMTPIVKNAANKLNRASDRLTEELKDDEFSNDATTSSTEQHKDTDSSRS